MTKLNSKNKGNRFERQVAKQLSKWMFDDDTILFRDSTSGGRKVSYRGDIIPVKQLPEWNHFKFYIEVKHGYNIQTFCNYDLTKQWIIKAENDMTDDQNILLLVVKHNYRQPYVIINRFVECLNLSIILHINDKNYYVYSLKEILNLNFLIFFKNLVEK